MKMKAILRKNERIILLLIITTLVYSSFYSIYPAKPGVSYFMGFIHDQPGWKAWFDQGEYYKMSTVIAQGKFNSSSFTYGLGYPVLGVPFALISPDDSSVLSEQRFFIPNLLIFLTIVYITFNLTYNLTQNTKVSILCVAFLLFLTLYIPWFIEPWNLHVTDIGVLGIFYIFFRNPENITKKHLIIAGLLAGWMFSASYLDIFWLIPIFSIFLIFNLKKIVYFIPGIMLIALVLFAHYSYFGNPLELPNVYHSVMPDAHNPNWDKVGFHAYDWDLKIIGERTFCILFDPQYCMPPKTGDISVDNHWFYALVDKTPILASSSAFLIISPFGIFILLKKMKGFQRKALVSLLIGFVVAWISYTSTVNFDSGWTRFFRYEMFWFPLFTIFSIYGMYCIYSKIKSRIHLDDV